LSGDLFDPIVTTDELIAATDNGSWIQAMLDAEAALALAEADTGLVPRAAATAIVACCNHERYDAVAIGRAARGGGNPAIPLITALLSAVPEPHRRWVHWGATSQDIVDTAAGLVARRAVDLIDADLCACADACAVLADRHRDTLMAGRTLLQHALPTTFGFKAAGWLIGVLDARELLRDAADQIAVQLGGAVGTLAAFGEHGPAVVAAFAARLDLDEPTLAWHTARQRVAHLGAALGIAAGTAAKIALDIELLMQTEVGEVAEPRAEGRGASSTLPHKRNPVGAAAVGAATRRAHALVPVLLGAMVAEHERAVGAWQAEWETLCELLRLAGGAVANVRDTVAGLEVSPIRMAANLESTRGVLMAERIAFALAPGLGADRARELVADAARRALDQHTTFATELRRDDVLAAHLDDAQLAELLEPSGYLGANGAFIDRALARHAKN
jgi:3-carboxy-cis,cis-muconate cycloisomerase